MSRRNKHKRFISPAPEQDRMPEWYPTFSLDGEIARARTRMGEDRWKQLNEEWELEQ